MSITRRTFSRLFVAAGAGSFVQRHTAKQFSSATEPERADPIAALEAAFATPPVSSRPFAFWHWMNGNVTRQGITLDLEAMQRSGIGGFYIYNNAIGIPRGPVDYASETWLTLIEQYPSGQPILTAMDSLRPMRWE